MRKPVFVDVTGDRRKAVVIVGAAVGVVLVLGLVTVLFGLLNSSPVPLPRWPETVQGGAEVAPPPAPPGPTATTPRPKITSTPPTASASSAAEPTRGNGNGNGHGRPSKTPGKP